MKRLIRLLGIIAIAVTAGFSLATCGDDDNDDDGDGDLIFADDFDGTSLDMKKWDFCPNWDRQGRSTWSDDMVSVSEGCLHIKFARDTALGKDKSENTEIADNWIRTGGVRTLKKNGSSFLFRRTFGYYEARIKFPRISGVWGAFWLMSPTVGDDLNNGGEEGTEIDIVETIHNEEDKFNAALHWNGYGDHHKSVGSENGYKSVSVDIYDGDFHTFAVNWTPSEYVFYVDDHEFWRVDGGPDFQNCGINKNPNYIKLTVESAPWAGPLPEDFTEAEMVVDYVRVYKQPPEK